MNAELLAILDYWEKEKGISRTVLLSAVEEALLSAAKKAVGPARELQAGLWRGLSTNDEGHLCGVERVFLVGLLSRRPNALLSRAQAP